jgi:hypothetical protein
LVDRRHGLDKLAAAFAEIRGGKIFEIHRTASQSCPRESEVESSVNPSQPLYRVDLSNPPVLRGGSGQKHRPATEPNRAAAKRRGAPSPSNHEGSPKNPALGGAGSRTHAR